MGGMGKSSGSIVKNNLGRFSKGGQLGYKELHAKNIPNLTDPRTVCRAGTSPASPTTRKLSQLRPSQWFGSAGLLRPLYYHRHGAGVDDLGATIPLPTLPGERELPAAVCADLS